MLSRLCTIGTPRAPTVWRSLCPAWRRVCSTSSGDGPGNGGDSRDKRSDKPPVISSSTSTTTQSEDDDDIDDGFGMDDFLVADDADDAADDDLQSRLHKLEGQADASATDADDPMATAELTSDLVSRMVSHLSRDDQLSQIDILPYVSPHTITVLRAVRICTNSVVASTAAASDSMYPINRRVVAHLDIAALGLSPPASEAVRLLAGHQRLQGRGMFVKVSCDKFPTKVENRTYIVSRLHSLVKQAKLAVGEEVDETPLKNWEEVVARVEQQAADEVREAGSVQNLLGQQQYQPFQQQQTQ